MNLGILKSIGRVVTLLSLDLYLKAQPTSHLEHLARVLPHSGGGKTFSLEWVNAFPQLRKWVGPRKLQESFGDAIKGELAPFEITAGYDRMDLELGDPLASASIQTMSESISEGFIVGKERLAYEVLLNNSVTYDGQDLFDTDHVHPDESTASNIIGIGTDVDNRGTVNEPTVIEVGKELQACQRRLLQNVIVRKRLVDAAEARGATRVIARSNAVYDAFDSLLQEERLPDGTINRRRGTFSLSRDFSPPVGMENSYDVLSAIPGGPRPVIFVVGKDMTGVSSDTSKEWSDREIPFGSDGIFGAAPGFWQTVVRVE